ncbi:endolytic transglycosylase MltG [Vibrio gallaecicus]|uniref:endolytic transglycosylase MltG n=1 Tax=Vibrio gallaecicus TaxID=552386 RepID=UPI0010C975DD|nr:endolytic transglycosylase MltG [Vibrio gallaecicus]MDN3614545.1 endolytic transglycosylase MltG [Vibrio gallaecicus]
MIKKLFIFIILCLVLAASAAFYVYNQAQDQLKKVIQLESSQVITINSGTSFNRVLNQLVDENLFTASPYDRLIRKLHPELVDVKAGTFLFEPGLTLEQALQVLVEGKEHQFTITFVEGSRFDEWMIQLKGSEFIQQTLEGVSEKEIAQKLGIDNQKLEGLFLAETYHYTYGTTDLDLLKRAHTNLMDVVNREWESKVAKLPLKSPYEALILASIIEKETAVASERERVSSVFINRLNKRMRLQTDPTVIYGMGDSYDGNIRKKDLRTPTPYNTYTINGLPPTPIAMAGKASIQAALNPEKSNYLYFVASGTGGHVFSKNLAEHNRAVRAYLKQLRKNKKK